MATLELATALGEAAELSVRRFSVHEAVSTPFTLRIWARSPHATLDLGAVVGQPASLRVLAGTRFTQGMGARAWSGVVRRAEQAHALQPAAGQVGLSSYYVEIVPRLWVLSQRRNRRIFQHLTIPDIVEKLLGEWRITPTWKIDRARYPTLEFKVQHNESDLDFVSRLLEEAGIAFTFAEEGQTTGLLLHDRLETNPTRPGEPVSYVDSPNQAAEREFVTNVRLGRMVKPGAVTMRDHDFRRPAFALFTEAPKAETPEDRYELYHYRPGGFRAETGKSEGTPAADDKGFARHDAKLGADLSQRTLEGARVGVRSVSFEANTFDLAPGSVFSIDEHPHGELPSSRKLLVLETMFEGTPDAEWVLSAHAVFADAPYRPPQRTPKPVVHGLQTAVVVGPSGQEIHTDEFGRVRVQLHWDREGKHDDGSSCWMRVAQGWGGTGFGSIVLPRIGQEVLVGFQEGDPDHPMVLGRAYNAVEQVPYKLPDHKTRSTWKSDSSPGSGGFNEIMFEDLAAKELVFQQAQKDRQRLVKNDEHITVGHDREKLVKNDELEQTLGFRKRVVDKDMDAITAIHKRERIDGHVDLTVEGSRHERIDGKQSLSVFGDRQETVEGSYALRANKQVHLGSKDHVGEAQDDVTIKGPGGFVRIDGSGVTIVGSVVKINAGGSPKAGCGSNPDIPEEPQQPEPEPEPEPKPEPPSRKTAWIGISLKNADGTPAAYERYRIKSSDGTVREGTLDAGGRARLEGIEPGHCEVTFPHVDAKEWWRG